MVNPTTTPTVKQKKQWFSESINESYASLLEYIKSSNHKDLSLIRADKKKIDFQIRTTKFRLESDYSILNGQTHFYTSKVILRKWECIDYLEMWGNTKDVHFTNGISESVAKRIRATRHYLPFGFLENFGRDYIKQVDLFDKEFFT